MKLDVTAIPHPLRWVGVLALLFSVYVVWSAGSGLLRMAPGPADVLFEVSIWGPPFLLLAYIARSWTRWRKLDLPKAGSGARATIAVVGSLLAAGSAAFLILFRPLEDLLLNLAPLSFWDKLSPVLACWLLAGTLMSLGAVVCGIAGAPRLRRPALLSALLLPIWYAMALILIMAMHD